jgi:hypothetical protein
VFSPGRRQLKLGIWCRSLGGVGHRVHFLELGDGDVGVDLGRRELCVAQDCLDKADIGAVGQHVGRHRVAKEVRGAGFIDASLKFFWRDAEQEDQDDTRGVQASLFEAPLRPLKPQEFTFFYRYTSGGAEHTQSIQDWEVQATYLAYQREYGSREKALEMMAQEYGQNIPTRNLHFIMGNMAKRQWQFIVIGLLRSGLDPQELAKQGTLF